MSSLGVGRCAPHASRPIATARNVRAPYAMEDGRGCLRATAWYRTRCSNPTAHTWSIMRKEAR
jgi:hypothetical protein